MTAKALYEGFTTSFPPPKVIFKFNIAWQLVWERLEYLVLEPVGQEVLFTIVHNIVPNRERLYSKLHMVNSLLKDSLVFGSLRKAGDKEGCIGGRCPSLG